MWLIAVASYGSNHRCAVELSRSVMTVTSRTVGSTCESASLRIPLMNGTKDTTTAGRSDARKSQRKSPIAEALLSSVQPPSRVEAYTGSGIR